MSRTRRVRIGRYAGEHKVRWGQPEELRESARQARRSRGHHRARLVLRHGLGKAHFHYTIMGGLIFAFMAGIYYWLPKMTGIKLNEKLGRLHFWTMFIFFNTTFLPLFALGLKGMPRRVFEYARNLETLNDWVSISAFCLGGSILIFGVNFVMSMLFWREPEVGNPWRARSLEWQLPSPPPPENFQRYR